MGISHPADKHRPRRRRAGEPPTKTEVEDGGSRIECALDASAVEYPALMGQAASLLLEA
jgi:hypothetical protein